MSPLDSSLFVGPRYGMDEVVELLKKEMAAVQAEVAEISLHVGSGLEDDLRSETSRQANT